VPQIQVAADAAYVLADSTQLTRALGNLFENAVQAGASQVKVAATASAGQIQISLSDNGSGMPADVLEKIWTPFFTTRAGHNGLGLPAALHIFTQLQGTIHIHSLPGQGTTVEIALPVGQPGVFEINQTPLISLIDDQDAWARFFTSAVKTAARVEKPDEKAGLILIDENIASLDIESVLAAIQQAGLASKTIVLTAALDVDRMTRLLRAGFRDVRLKPYSPAEIPALWEK